MKEVSSEWSYHRLCAFLSKLVNVAAPTTRSSAYRNGCLPSEWALNLLTGRRDGLKGFLASQPSPLKPPTPPPPAPHPLHTIAFDSNLEPRWPEQSEHSHRAFYADIQGKANPLTRNITSQQTELTMENFVTQNRNSPTDSAYHSLGIIFIWWLWRQLWKTNHAAIRIKIE